MPSWLLVGFPAGIRAQGGVAQISDPSLIKEIKRATSIPAMSEDGNGHFAETSLK